MRWFFSFNLIRQPDGRWRWRKGRLWFHLGNSSNYKGPCIRICVSVIFVFFSFFGVGLGAVLVVHIFDGFPDKKLVRRDLKFFVKSFKWGDCETFLYLSPLYQFRIGEDPSSSTPVLRGRRGASEREARWRPRDPSQSRKRESPFRALDPRWRPVDFRWRKRARARASKNFRGGLPAFYWDHSLVLYIKLIPRLRSIY